MKVKVRDIEDSPYQKGCIRVSAEVIYDDHYADEVIWFDIEKKYREKISISGNPWVVCLLSLAAYLGEDIEIDKPCNYELLTNLQEVLAVWNSWDEQRKKITIKCAVSIDDSQEKERQAAFFSGGVDSFFTALKLEDDANKQKGKPLTDLIFVWGFDIPLSNRNSFEKLHRRLKNSADELGVNLLFAITNIRETRFKESGWLEYSHGAALSSVAHIFENYLDKVYLGSSDSYYALEVPAGSHPMVDNLFTSSLLKFCLHGSGVKRVGKTNFIVNAGREFVLNELHVCWKNASEINCCQCSKCYRTMVALEILDVLDDSPAFERPLLFQGEIERVINSSGTVGLFEELVDFAYSKNKPDIARAVEKSVQRSRRVHWLLSQIDFLKRTWPLRRLGIFLEGRRFVKTFNKYR